MGLFLAARAAPLWAVTHFPRSPIIWSCRRSDLCQNAVANARTGAALFEHVHGDSRDRCPAMIDIGQTYEKAGLSEGQARPQPALP